MQICNPMIYAHTQGCPEPYIYGVYTVFLAGESSNILLNTVYKYGSGQPYTYVNTHM